MQGRWRAAADALFGQSIHTLFPLFCLPPALLEQFAGLHLAWVAAYFGLFSILAIFLIWAIALRAGASEAEALWAAYLAACANSLFYYSRHFFPYDLSLCAMLFALWLALRAGTWRRSVLVGAMAGIGFLTYNGYWWLGGCVLILHAFLGGGGGKRGLLIRMACAGAALVMVLGLMLGVSRSLGHDPVAENGQGISLRFGDVTSGPRVIAEYLWYAERGFLLILMAGLGYALFGAWRDRRLDRLAWYVGGIALVVAGLIFLSDAVLFPVQGRRVREVIPFLCLGAALGIDRLVRERLGGNRLGIAAIAALAGAMAAWNFSTPLRQVFPSDFQRLAAGVASLEPGYRTYRMAFVGSVLGVRLDGPLPPYPTLLRRPHPLQFRPYQYEGYDATQRADINAHDISMRLIGLPGRFDADHSRWQGYPGPVRFLVRLPSGTAARSEPLVVTGRAGKGDIFYIHYVDSRHLSFGLDHWGVRATNSRVLAVDYSRPHEIILSAGFLLPPRGGAPGPADLEPAGARDRLLVRLDGQTVFSMTESFYPVPPTAISFGVNFIGGSIAEPQFTGDILEFGPALAAGLDAVLAIPKAVPSASHRP
jgi:hypothetical protein